MPKISLATIVISLFLFCSCGEKSAKLENETFSTGKVKDGKYVNEFFDFSLTLPDEHYLIAESELEVLQKDNEKRIKEKTDADDEVISRMQQIFGLRLYDQNRITTAMINPTFLIVTERLDPRVKDISARDFLLIARKQYKKSNQGSAGFEETATVKIGGELFERQIIVQQLFGFQVKTAQYCKIINGYAVIFNLVYDMKKDRQKLVSILSSFEQI